LVDRSTDIEGEVNMHAQRGITLTGFIVFAIIFFALLLVGFKIGPAYMEFYTIQKIFRTMAADSALQNATRGEINSAFNARAGVDNVKIITHDDLDVVKDGSTITLSATYSVRIPLAGNLSACMDFRPTSAK
jgi:Domain of unknown function (DUF4845)